MVCSNIRLIHFYHCDFCFDLRIPKKIRIIKIIKISKIMNPVATRKVEMYYLNYSELKCFLTTSLLSRSIVFRTSLLKTKSFISQYFVALLAINRFQLKIFKSSLKMSFKTQKCPSANMCTSAHVAYIFVSALSNDAHHSKQQAVTWLLLSVRKIIQRNQHPSNM